MDDDFKIIIRRDTWEVVPRNSFSDHNMLPGKSYFYFNSKPGKNISKWKALYCSEENVYLTLK